MSEPVLVTVAEAAERLHVTKDLVREWVRTDRVPIAYRSRKRTQINWELVQRHLADGGTLTPGWWREHD